LNNKFDELAKGLAQSVTRRQALKRFGVGLAACKKENTIKRLYIVGVLAMALSTSLLPAQVPLTFNTGVDDTGSVLPTYATDPHYKLIASADPRFPGPATVVVDDTLFPIATGDWIASSATSKWIAPQGDQDYGIDPNYGDPTGYYTYRITFDLTGLNPDLVQLVGQWTADSQGAILMNGATTGIAISTNMPQVLRTWHPFVISTGFLPATNTLDFVVERMYWGGAPNLPTGLRAEFIVSNLPPPSLQIGAAGHLTLIWWPTNTPSFLLEASADLGNPRSWRPFAVAPVVVGSQNVVVADPASGTRFFRLRQR
jgi:hypothetical protein